MITIGKDFVIKTLNKRTDNDVFIQNAVFNGKKLIDMSISHDEIKKGGELILSY